MSDLSTVPNSNEPTAPSSHPHVSLQIEPTESSTPVAGDTAGSETIVNPAAPVDSEPLPTPPLRDSKGWDGKLRVPPSALASASAQIANPEALSDPDYSDDENVLPGDKIEADEGTLTTTPVLRSRVR